MKKIKCVVWDLDNTLWDGILMEDKEVVLRPVVVEVIRELDKRGILNSISSKNDFTTAVRKLEAFSIEGLFLYPQINWNPKSVSLSRISKDLNIGIDTFAFVDDQAFERDEVAFTHPEVMCIADDKIGEILNRQEFCPRFITEDSAMRRTMYQNEIKRKQAEEAFTDIQEEFLKSLDMILEIREAQENDLKRAEELTVRTNQLNTTGITYSYDELKAYMKDPNHRLYIASLEDKYGAYGKVGIALVDCRDCWRIKLFLLSCRVMSRGVGPVFLNYLISEGMKTKKPVQAEFISNNKNRMMLINYRMIGFTKLRNQGDVEIMEYKGSFTSSPPDYLSLVV